TILRALLMFRQEEGEKARHDLGVLLFMPMQLIAAVIAVLIGLIVPQRLIAVSIEYQLGDLFNGAAPASTNKPWVQAMFEDIAPGKVRLTLSTPNLVQNESVDKLYLNLNPAFIPGNLSFKFLTSSGGFVLPTIRLGEDNFKAVGDGRYDIEFDFSNAGSINQWFSGNEYVTYEVTGISTLSPMDFAFMSTPAGGSGPFYAAAHIQRIGTS